jgi:putative transposase
MPTHYHILSRVKNSEKPPGDLDAASLAMQKWIISYTKAINKRYNRTGALFQGQFQAKLIQASPHLLSLCVYIHANPVKDGLVALPEDWEFFNYLDWMNLRKGSLVNRGWIHEQFETPAEYRALVMNYINNRCLPEEVQDYVRELER